MSSYKKKKGVFSCTLAAFLASVGVLSGCAPVITDPEAEGIDPTKTQLYVFNYNSGFGAEWIDNIKTEYEALNANTIYEPGVKVDGKQKKGVQVVVKSQKEEGFPSKSNMDRIPGRREEVYFTEFSYYYDLYTGGVLGDITSAVTGDLSKRYVGYDENGALINGDGMADYASKARETAGSTILNKMSDVQKNYFNINNSGKYYALPHYAGYYGLTYNVDMFDTRGYYFSDAKDSETYNFEGEDLVDDWFINALNTTKSAGPDGEKGNEDDGLPATYKEFFMLCQYMIRKGDIPITWNGNASNSYLNYLLQALVVDHDGLDNTMVTYNMEGTIDNLVSITTDDKGNVTDADLSKTEEMTIAYGDGNAWNVSRSAGRYYALKFMEGLINGKHGMTTGGYYQDGIFSSTNSHITVQKNYVTTNIKSKEKIGMLVDGIWWENEAAEAFNALESQSNGTWTKETCNFKFMPLPHATKAEIGQKRTVLDSLFSLCFMKSNIAEEKKPLAIDFIKFVNTHDQLVKFTQTTNTVKSLNYSLTDKEKENLTTFGQSVVNMRETADVVYPFATHAHYQANASGQFFTHTLFNYSEGQKYVGDEMYRNDTTAADYFKNMVTYYKKSNVWTGKAN